MAKSNVAEINAAPERDLDKIDELSALLAQLRAQLAVIGAEGLEHFNCCSDTIKSNYIWAMCREVERAQELCESL